MILLCLVSVSSTSYSFKCMLNTNFDETGIQSEGSVTLRVAKPARVEFEEYGDLRLSGGKFTIFYYL